MRGSRIGRALTAVLAVSLLVVTGCANVPEESQAKVVNDQEIGQAAPVEAPAKDLDPLGTVRAFVHASAQSAQRNEAARIYLDDAANQAWRPDRTINVIEDIFGTTPAVGDDQSDDPNERVVLLKGFQVGRLHPDGAFIPGKEPYERTVRLRKQQDNQWKIVEPPGDIVVAESDFNANYHRVPLYFFAPESSALVPDLRYVVAKPQAGLPGRVVDLLLRGPSEALVGAVRNPLGSQAALVTNVATSGDGAVEVPLTNLGGQSDEDLQLIAAQIVKSLQPVVSNRIRLLSDGKPLVQGHEDWRPADLPAYEAPSSPGAELPGLVGLGGRLRSLGTGDPVPGPVGNGGYDVLGAAQSIDGKQLAVIERFDGKARLRVGDYGGELAATSVVAGALTRPTWRPALSASSTSGELWTAVDGEQVVRVQRTPEGKWMPQTVNAADVASLGPISALRLSRDGARVAVVAGGQLVVASVVRNSDSVTLRAPRVLKAGELIDVIDVDWANQEQLVAATKSPSVPVARVTVDGLRLDKFNSSNLTPPVHAITAAPSRPIVVSDAGGLWTANDVGEVWRPHEQTLKVQGAEAKPFYPG